jgi:hypothetical protein
MGFEFLLQGEYLMTYHGFTNREVYNDLYELHGWSLLLTHVKYNAIIQAIITASRIQFEQFMNFIYFSFEQKEIKEESGSKFTRFKNWLIGKGHLDNLLFLMPVLIACRNHDDLFRTPEVHKGSKLKSDLFALRKPEVDADSILVLSNYMLDIMKNLMPILDYNRAFNIKYIPAQRFDFDYKDWSIAYYNKEEEKLYKYMQFFIECLK